MRKALLCGLLVAATAPAAQAATAPPLVPRELASLARHGHSLLRLAPGRNAAAEQMLRRAGGVRISRRLSIWRLPAASAQRLAPRLAVSGALLDLEPDRNRTRLGQLQSGDPLLALEWWLAHVGADRLEPPGPGVAVSVIDSGLDLSHPEFAGRPDTTTLNDQTVDVGDESHGTAVSSLVGAPANGVGVVGIYPRAALRSFDFSPTGRLTDSAVIAGIEAAAAEGPSVINLSLGGPSLSRFEALAIVDAFERGSIVVASSGNDRQRGDAPSFPASLPHVLTVGSTDGQDVLASFSSSSPGMDVVVPGVDIPVAVVGGSGYGLGDGTSFSAPIFAGAVAWVWTVRSDLDNTQIFEVMRRSARDLGSPGRESDTGFGLLDVPNALTLATPSADPLEPNDDVEQVQPGVLFPQGKPLLTQPGRGRADLIARLDVTDDPRDLYRIWVPARTRVSVRVVGPNVALQLRLQSPSLRGKRRSATELELQTTGQRGVIAYISCFIRRDAQPTYGDYSLAITTTRVRR